MARQTKNGERIIKIGQHEHTQVVELKKDTVDGVPSIYYIEGVKLHNVITAIPFQSGPVKETETIDGVFHEDLIAICIDRLRYFQETKFNCDENREAIIFLEAALSALNRRTIRRASEGKKGTSNI